MSPELIQSLIHSLISLGMTALMLLAYHFGLRPSPVIPTLPQKPTTPDPVPPLVPAPTPSDPIHPDHPFAQLVLKILQQMLGSGGLQLPPLLGAVATKPPQGQP